MHRRLLNAIVLWLLALATLPATAWARQPGSNGAGPSEIRTTHVDEGVRDQSVSTISESLRFPSLRTVFAELASSSRTAFDLNDFAARPNLANRDGPYVGFCALGFKATDADGLNPRQTLLWCITAHGRVFMFLERTTDQQQASLPPLDCAVRPAGLAVGIQSAKPDARNAPAAAMGPKALVKRVRSFLAIALAGSVLLAPPPNAYATSDDLAAGAPMGRGQEILPNTPRRPADGRLGPIPGWDLAAGPSSSSAVFSAETQQVLVSWPDVVDFASTGFRICREVLVDGDWADRTFVEVPADQLQLNDQPPATGTYRYRVMAFNEMAITRWSPPSQALAEITQIDPPPPPPPPGPVVDPFWTVFTPSADTRIVYVSSSMGDDANDGLSEATPKRTLAAGWTLVRNSYPDWLLLKRGDVFSESLPGGKSGRSLTEPLLYGAYGNSSVRPLLQTGSATGLSLAGTRQHLAIVGIAMQANTYDGSTTPPSGIFGYGDFTNLLIEDCSINNFKDGIVFQADDRIAATASVRNLAIRRSIVTDSHCAVAHSQGMYLDSCDGLLIEECVVDSNGFKTGVTGPSIFNHDIYINNHNARNHIVRGNIISRSASHGLQARAGGQITNNLFIKTPIALLAGGGDTPVEGGVDANVTDNVIILGTDIDATNRRGFGIDLKNLRSAEVRRNIVADKLTTNVGFAIGSFVSGGPIGVGVQNTLIADNVISNWAGNFSFGNFQLPYYEGSVVRGNRVVFDGSVFNNYYVGWEGVALPAFDGNRYQGQRSGSRVFRRYTTVMDFAGWVAAYGETNASLETTPLDTPFDFAQYVTANDLGSDVDAFLAEARQQSRFNWRESYTATAINAVARTAYGIVP